MIEIAPDATDQEKVTVVKAVASEGVQRRSPKLTRLDGNWDLYIGQHWKYKPPRGHEVVTLNYIGTLLDNLVSFLVGANPEFEPWPVDGSIYSEDVYRITNRLMKSWWHRNQFKEELDVFMRMNAIYGVGLMQFMPPNNDDPEPDLKLAPVDIFSCVFDMDTRHWDMQNGRFFVTITVENRRAMEHLFGTEIRPSTEFKEELRLYRQEDTAPRSRERGQGLELERAHYVSGGSEVEMADNKIDEYPRTGYYSDDVTVIRLYFRDNVPGGIRVLTVAGDTLVEDASTPFQEGWLRGKFPFAQCNFTRTADSPYGIGFPDRLEDIQIQLNKKTALLFDWISQLPKTPLIIPDNLGINTAKITSRTGLILRPTNALFSRYIRFLQTPSVSPAVIEAIKELLVHMERIGGLPDVTEGRRPTGITAASAIIALQEKSKQKFQHQVRNTEAFLTDCGCGIVAGMQQYYLEAKPYYGYDDMGYPELLKYGGTSNISPALLLATASHRVRVRASSTLEVSRYALEERYVQLHGLGLVSDEDLIEALDMPGKERIKQTIQKKKLLAQLAQLQAEGNMDQPPGFPQSAISMKHAVPSGTGVPPTGANLNNPASGQRLLSSAVKRTQGMRVAAGERQ